MIEVIPNWHPIFVHFTIALLSMSVLFHLLHALLPKQHRWQNNMVLLAQANLWIGTGFAIITAIAGWFAYNSVAHDTASHAAMTEHRNWALITLGIFFTLATWSVFRRKKNQANVIFTFAILIAGGLLATTGWHGAESVYRYGLGVISLPNTTGEGHDHHHTDNTHNDDSSLSKPVSPATMKSTKKQAEVSPPLEKQADISDKGSPDNLVNNDDKTNVEETQKKSSHDDTPHKH